VLFNGEDGAGLLGLWVTDGTTDGTHAITGIAGTATTGLDPTDMAVFNNGVLFNGVDASGHTGLWETYGTAGGTHEITVAGADASGLDPSDLTVYNGGSPVPRPRPVRSPELWVTDGTTAGTQELSVSGTSSLGLSPSDLVVSNGQVLFHGLDASGLVGLWTTNGTAAGTQELTPIFGAGLIGVAPFDLTAATLNVTPVPSDGRSDILLQNTGGQAAMWEMVGSDVIADAQVGPNPGPSWTTIERATSRRWSSRHPVSEHESVLDLGNGRDQYYSRCTGRPQSWAELEGHRNGRFQR
jgi:ELWxxDGT repeat protein